MGTIRTMIVDDEPLARERLRSLLARQPDVQVVGEFGSGRQAMHAVQEHHPDLLFLDVQMPEVDGFGLLEALEEKFGEKKGRGNGHGNGNGKQAMPVVIFVTAYDQYALRAFEVHAFDYLLKPFDDQRFHEALERARQQLQLALSGREESVVVHRRLLSLVQEMKNRSKPMERLVVRSAGRVFFLRTEEIDWIEAASNYVRLHVAQNSHLLRETMNGIEGRLDPDKFLRIHRSTIVNVDRIKELQPWFHGDYAVILSDGTRLTLSRSHREKLQKLFSHANA
jgi:two-component system LytT family response regulator